ncbi:DUF927 domain-containing protein [[Haemophilus] felis]|uniref:DNA primase n=1 Tax=[Haemophilus] felis TaxID=123822 RepID=A0A1T0AVT9_9PAST|nr:DUF927 domain-containing protein [[Haemophilus] felis]OOS01132.1 DNA primase [[Haemophilus] felis]
MANKLKKAPHLEQQQASPFDDWLILAGGGAWQAWGTGTDRKGNSRKGQGEEWLLLCQVISAEPTNKPVILSSEALEEVADLKIAPPTQRFIKIVQFGELPQRQVTALCQNIAIRTEADSVLLCDSLGQEKENLSDYIKKLRTNSEALKLAENITERRIETKTDTRQDKRQPYIENRTEGEIKGLYRITPKYDNHTGELLSEKVEWLSDVVEVVAMGRSDDDYYTMLKFTPYGSEEAKTIALPLREVGERAGWQLLRKNGLNITNSQKLRPHLADYLQRYQGKGFYNVVNSTGWQKGAYILPNGEVIGKPQTPVFFVGQSANKTAYTQSGTLESWQREIADNVKGNYFMMLGVAVALSAPLIHLVNAESFGVHIFGGSSTGKTTIANIASSIYANPEEVRLSWFSTALGLSNEAQARNDGFMPLDEIGQGSNRKQVADTAYTLFNGVGKLQGAKEGGNRDLARWRTVAFSTGEIDLETYLTNAGIKTNVGQLVRLLNIPIQRAEQFHQHQDGKTHADYLNQASRLNYGVVGRAWISQLIDLHQQDQIKPLYQAILSRRLETLPNDAHSQVKRVVSRFSLLETALLLSQNLTGWQKEESETAISKAFSEWVNIFGYHSREERQIIEQVNGWLLANAEGRFIRYPFDPFQRQTVHNVAGYRIIPESNDKGEDEHFYLYPLAFEEATKGHPKEQSCKILAEKGLLDKGEGRYKFLRRLPHKIDSKRTRCFLLYPINEKEEEESEA